MEINFKDNLPQLTKDLKAIKASAIPKATVQALNKVGAGSLTDAKREVSRITGIKQKDIAPQTKPGGQGPLYRTGATKNKMSVTLNARKGKAKNLIHFVKEGSRKPNEFNYRRMLKSGRKGKYKAKGVKAKAWGKTKTYEGTFIGKGKTSGKHLVFARKSGSRTPLKSILGPSIRNTFDSAPIQAKLKSQAKVRFNKNMTAAVRNQIRIATKGRVKEA